MTRNNGTHMALSHDSSIIIIIIFFFIITPDEQPPSSAAFDEVHASEYRLILHLRP